LEAASIRALCQVVAWPQPVAAVELIETHISWVFLTGEYAYKIKKPVNFGFLDFSTLEKRRHWCEEEVRLNRRLASDIYLDVVTVCGSTDAPGIGGEGEVLDYAVRMRQFDTRQGFDQLLARRELLPAHLDQAAEILAAFHREIAVAEPKAGFGTPGTVDAQVRENFEQIRPCIDRQIADVRERDQFERVEQWSLAASERLGRIVGQRLADGFVRE
jgi:aminoglycoside phosphotransferase family enzyme